MACSACKIGMRRPPRRGGILAPFIHRFIKTKLPRYIHPGWVRVDSGVPVTKQTRHQAVLCERSSLAFSCLKCSSQVNLDLEASRIFRPTPHTTLTTPHTTFWSNFRKHVNTDKAPRQCTLSGLESILAFLSRSLCGIMRREAQTV